MKYTDEQMLDELRRAANELGTPTISRPAFIRVGRISAPAITVRFGGWLKALELAGLQSPYAFGGVVMPCPVCGTTFRFEGGKKARKTCSPKCTSELMTRLRTKGRDASPQAARGRARYRTDVSRCADCGATDTQARIEVHHKDRDPYNNTPDNLEPLCTKCHRKRHGQAQS